MCLPSHSALEADATVRTDVAILLDGVAAALGVRSHLSQEKTTAVSGGLASKSSSVAGFVSNSASGSCPSGAERMTDASSREAAPRLCQNVADTVKDGAWQRQAP